MPLVSYMILVSDQLKGGTTLKELKGAALKKFVKTATPSEIIAYWKNVTAPKYGYTQLVNPVTGEIVAKAQPTGRGNTPGKERKQTMKVDSQEYKDLMKKWSDEAWQEETQRDYDEYIEHKENYKS